MLLCFIVYVASCGDTFAPGKIKLVNGVTTWYTRTGLFICVRVVKDDKIPILGGGSPPTYTSDVFRLDY